MAAHAVRKMDGVGTATDSGWGNQLAERACTGKFCCILFLEAIRHRLCTQKGPGDFRKAGQVFQRRGGWGLVQTTC